MDPPRSTKKSSTDVISRPGMMHRRSASQWLNYHPTDAELSSNPALGLQSPPYPNSQAVTTNPDNRSKVNGDARSSKLHKPKAASQGVELSTSPSDVRTRLKRSLRVSSRLRVYYDQLRSSVPSPASEDILPLSNIPASTSESKSRSRSFRFWQPSLFTLNESPSFWLLLYFFFNLSLTLYNKFVLINFPFPYTLTALHALCSAAGSSMLLRSSAISYLRGQQDLSSLNWQEVVALISFSTLFTINIATSNISLDLVTVPFHQVVRATTPLFTILLSRILLGSHVSRDKMISLVPIVAGVAFATYGDYYFTLWGFLLTLLGTVLAALKTIITNVMQTPSHSSRHTSSVFLYRFLQPRPTLSTLSPLEHLHLLSPLAFFQSLILAQMTGELKAMCHHMLYHLHPRQHLCLVFNGLLAFGLNVASFGANKRVGAVTMSVAANVKQVLTMLGAVLVFNLQISPANSIGILLTLCGGAWYTAVELREKERKRILRESV
ncbi:Triose-phosphate Transporter family domain containing protein [Amanita muscaria]